MRNSWSALSGSFLLGALLVGCGRNDSPPPGPKKAPVDPSVSAPAAKGEVVLHVPGMV